MPPSLDCPIPGRGKSRSRRWHYGKGKRRPPEEISGFCWDRIASYKIPVHVVFLRLDEFPRTSTGKIHKLALCEVIAARLGASATPLRHREGTGGADPGAGGVRPCVP